MRITCLGENLMDDEGMMVNFAVDVWMTGDTLSTVNVVRGGH